MFSVPAGIGGFSAMADGFAAGGTRMLPFINLAFLRRAWVMPLFGNLFHRLEKKSERRWW